MYYLLFLDNVIEARELIYQVGLGQALAMLFWRTRRLVEGS